MRAYSLIAPAKINFYLEIIGDRPDGYHELAMVMQSVSLADQIDLRANGIEQFRLTCDHPEVPADQTNLAYKAATLMAQQFPQAFQTYGAVDIAIHKRIPVGAGLAGGSTDAAAVLVGLDLIWKLGLTQPEIQQLGASLGSDVPFCVTGGTAIATGRGERLAPLAALDPLYVVLAKYRSLSVSTAWAYTTYRQQFGHTYTQTNGLEGRRQRVHSGAMVLAVSHNDGKAIAQHLHNDLEKIVLPALPQVQQLRAELAQLSSLGAMMSGSGPSVFALATSRANAETIQAELKAALPDPDLEVWVAQTIASGIQLKQ